jgi:hypothetical protein
MEQAMRHKSKDHKRGGDDHSMIWGPKALRRRGNYNRRCGQLPEFIFAHDNAAVIMRDPMEV